MVWPARHLSTAPANHKQPGSTGQIEGGNWSRLHQDTIWMRDLCKADHGCPFSRHSRRPGYLDGLVWLLAPACQLPHCCLGQALVTPPPAQDPPLLKDAGSYWLRILMLANCLFQTAQESLHNTSHVTLGCTAPASDW